MKLRTILISLSLLALASSLVGGYLYYSSLEDAALTTVNRQAQRRAEAMGIRFEGFIREQLKPVRVLANLGALSRALDEPNADSLAEANALLDLFTEALDVDVCYLMNVDGLTVASSNRDTPRSFVGRNFGFRPYFQGALTGQPQTYMALGTTSGVRGLYYSHPVYGSGRDEPLGVAVIKASIDGIERELAPVEEEIVMLLDPHGIIFLTSRPEWLFRSIWKLSPAEVDEIARSIQFGRGPWEWVGLELQGDRRAIDQAGRRYLAIQVPVEDFPGWTILYLRNYRSLLKGMLLPLTRTQRTVVIVVCLLIGGTVLLLYRQASSDLKRRRVAEAALREKEERYRSLYHNTPAILHSIDPSGRLLSVSDYWTEALGHSREEVIGRQVTDFMTPSSRKKAESIVIPEFMTTGYCRDVAYEFVKKDGTVIDVLLSAIAERDERGTIVRSLAVLLDVTQLKRAQAELERAKEALDRYSKELESQVSERTGEVAGILRHTPAVIYIKDLAGKYMLVNSRFEELFGVRDKDVRGRTDRELFPAGASEWFQRNDLRVVESGRPIQEEQTLPLPEGRKTYLSVKFPLFNAEGAVYALCGISTDITLIKRAQTELRRLSASIMEGQEKERAAIARELHDQLGQILTALRIDTMWMVRRMEQAEDAAAATRAKDMCTLIDSTIDEVRRMAIRLRPGVLDDLGLIAALEWYVADFEKRTDITCTLRHGDVPRIPDLVATAAYRICQEALTNVARHSAASHAEVTLGMESGKLFLRVTDDGRGFSTSLLQETVGLGVTGMRERASLLGGRLEIESEPGGGATVMCRLPLAGSGEEKL